MNANCKQKIPDKIVQLWEVADKIWTKFDKDPAFSSYVSADYEAVYQSLAMHRMHADRFLELGAGLGVVT
ncbi:MAG: hypothetical protein AAGA30_05695, partial [Planctomycetota bacterium]